MSTFTDANRQSPEVPRKIRCMKNAALCLLLILGCQTLKAQKTAEPIQIEIHASQGTYSIENTQMHWTFLGTVGHPLDHVTEHQGRSSLGAYREYRFQWKDQIPYVASIRYYPQRSCLVFSLTLPKGFQQSPEDFPIFQQIPSGLSPFSFKNTNFAPPTFSLVSTSTPWLFFNQKDQAFIISPASDFMISRMQSSDAWPVSSGLNKNLLPYAKPFTHQTVLVMGAGIQHTWDAWGACLRNMYHRVRPANDADKVLKYFGYWTDNGADYYYNYDTTLGYAGTLIALRKRYEQEGIPLGYMQLDSWWYEKSATGVNGENTDHKNPRLPYGAWNRYGGLLSYTADPFLFPHGLAAFQHSLGLPLVTHNRWIDPKSPYHHSYTISGIAALDPGYWHSIISYIHNAGVICYEQDWLNFIYNLSPALQNNVARNQAFTNQMAAACHSMGLDMQYCMAMPRYFLQGLKYPNLTTIRTSDDRFEPARYRDFVYVSQLAYEIGSWPWSDVFKSHETGNMILSLLSAGPVGTGDAMGKEDKATILMACRPDGILVKPDVPALPMDQDYLQQTHAGAAEGPMLARTYTQHGTLQTTYLFAFAQGSKGTSTFHFSPKEWDAAPHETWIIYNKLTQESSEISSAQTFTGHLGPDGYSFLEAAPVSSSGIAFLGDRNKFVSTGKARIPAIHATTHGLQIRVAFASGESKVQLFGYARQKPSPNIGTLTYDASTHLFDWTVPNAHATPSELNATLTVR